MLLDNFLCDISPLFPIDLIPCADDYFGPLLEDIRITWSSAFCMFLSELHWKIHVWFEDKFYHEVHWFLTPEKCSSTISSFSHIILPGVYIFKSHQPNVRYSSCLPFSFRLIFHFLPSTFLNTYFPLTLTFSGLMNCIDELRSQLSYQTGW